jgi:hypothetical protein
MTNITKRLAVILLLGMAFFSASSKNLLGKIKNAEARANPSGGHSGGKSAMNYEDKNNSPAWLSISDEGRTCHE